uniref:Zinc-finger domain-containing protein n=1 Tax=Solibacter usitatus (strain Ellin6076) TaxID=234267 RepID=Q01TN6_SOLUE
MRPRTAPPPLPDSRNADTKPGALLVSRVRVIGAESGFYLRTLCRFSHYAGMNHISDHDLERLHLGMVKDDAELAMIEEHLLWCPRCIDAAEEAAQYVDTMRAAIIEGNFAPCTSSGDALSFCVTRPK